ncbi:MAG: hypothetical protein ABJF67_19335, partial [Aurantimonas coralicida]
MPSIPRRSARMIAATALLGAAGIGVGLPGLPIARPALAQSAQLPLFPELRTDDARPAAPQAFDPYDLRAAPLTRGTRIDPSLIDRLEQSGGTPGDDRRGPAGTDAGTLPPDPRDATETDGASSPEFDLFSGPAAAPQGRAATSRPAAPVRSFDPEPEAADVADETLAEDPRDAPAFSARPSAGGPASAVPAVAPRNPPLAAGIADEAPAVDSPLRTSRTVITPERAPVATSA